MIDKKHHFVHQICFHSNMHFSSINTFFFFLFILCFSGPTMVDSQDTFHLPSPLPIWPPGGGFANGTMDLGGLLVTQVTTFSKIWSTNEGGPDNLGASFYDPTAIPQGFSSLGSYAQPNNIPLFGHVLVAKDVSNNSSNPTLVSPFDYTLVWSSESLDIEKDGEGYVWLPVAPDGYTAVGYIITNSSVKPALDKVGCVRLDFTDTPNTITVGLENINDFDLDGLNVVYGSVGGFQLQNVSVGNLKGNLSNSMPNLNQINALIQAYAPVIYFHPDEPYLPSSVDWFFQNGALLYHIGNESKPSLIERNGSNLPQGGWNDETYWLDLPLNGSSKDRVKKGDLQDACAYFHVKPVFGGLFTDIAIWVFYPFNGGSRAKVGFINISLGKMGEHVGDWEHVTLRISNFNGELNGVFFSQHSWGKWVSASGLEYHTGNKPVVYASLHGHASYPKPGCVLLGPRGADIGIRDDTTKSDKLMDTSVRATVVAAEYMAAAVVEPPWLNYERKWGPKIDYDIDKELMKMKRLMIGKIKKAFVRFVERIPSEILGEDGPTGPKVKDSWSGNECVVNYIF